MKPGIAIATLCMLVMTACSSSKESEVQETYIPPPQTEVQPLPAQPEPVLPK